MHCLAPKFGYAELSHHRVYIMAGNRHLGPFWPDRHDGRNGPILGSGTQGNDSPPAGRHLGAAVCIKLAACAAEVARSNALRADLSVDIDLQSGINADHLVILGT